MTDFAAEIDEYVEVALANGFSKGTANVSPRDMKKLRPLLNYYRKKPHPFRACVRDNRKRFGPRTEAICAVVKDLIKGHTKWRGKGKEKSNMSQEELDAFILEPNDEFFAWLSEIEEDDVEEWARLSQGDVEEDEVDTMLSEVVLSGGDTEEGDGFIWKTILREGRWAMSPDGNGKAQAKPLTITKDGKSDPENMVISMSEIAKNFRAGAVEHVQITPHEGKVLDNMGFARNVRMRKGDNGKYELQAALDFTEPEAKGKAERGTLANTSAGIRWNFVRPEDGKKFTAVLDHVAPTNRPWLNGLKPFGADLSEDEDVEIVYFSQDETDLERPLYALRGAADSIRSAIRLEEDEAEKDKLYAALKEVVAVLAKCEKEYGVGDESTVSGYAQDVDAGGGEDMPEKDEKEKVVETDEQVIQRTLGLSAEDAKAALAERDELRKKDRRREIDAKVAAWDGKKAPALVNLAKEILNADRGENILNLSQDGSQVEVTASDIAERFMEAAPDLKLSNDPVKDEDVEGEKPKDDAEEENKDAKLSQDVAARATELFLSGKAPTEEKAVEMAKKELGEDSKDKGE